MYTIKIAHVSIKRSKYKNELLKLRRFLSIPREERARMIKVGNVEFVGFDGEKIETVDALKQIVEMYGR